MADLQYNGVLSTVYCGVCNDFFALEDVAQHACFVGMEDCQLTIEGNVVNIEGAVQNPINSEPLIIELDSTGCATQSTNNLIHLIEMVRETPCLWDIRLPLPLRSPPKIAEEWERIGNFFKGWGGDLAKKRFSNLKTSFFRRKKAFPSGSAAKNQKPWDLEPYLGFLNDATAPEYRTTSSNVPSLPRTSRVQDLLDESSQEYFSCTEDACDEPGISEKKDNTRFGFVGKKNQAKKRKVDGQDRLENAIVELATAKTHSKTSIERKNATPMEQWASWLATEICDFPNKNDRLDIQNYITSYLKQKRYDLNL